MAASAVRSTASGVAINESYSLAVAAHSEPPMLNMPATTGDLSIVTVCVQLTRSFRGGNSICSVSV